MRRFELIKFTVKSNVCTKNTKKKFEAKVNEALQNGWKLIDAGMSTLNNGCTVVFYAALTR
jgi:hypothetical protein